MTRTTRDSRFGLFSRSAFAAAFASMFALAMSPAVSAQDATPAASPPPEDGSRVVIQSPDDEGVENSIGEAIFTEEDGTVTINVEVEGLEAGDHGIHIHEIGICDPDADPQYSTAGAHFNPTDATHGPGPQSEATAEDATPADDASESHAGDLGNITIDEDGTGTLEVTTDRFSMDSEAETTLADENGSALVIHENPDDLETDPSGESGDRIACGVIFAGLDATPVTD